MKLVQAVRPAGRGPWQDYDEFRQHARVVCVPRTPRPERRPAESVMSSMSEHNGTLFAVPRRRFDRAPETGHDFLVTEGAESPGSTGSFPVSNAVEASEAD